VPLTELLPSDPARLGGYRLLGRLGQGGMGTVFLGLASDGAHDGQAVAIKVLREGGPDPDSRLRFARELQALQRVRGPHLVELLHADVAHDPAYLVTRFVPGERLDHVVPRDGPRSTGQALTLARGIVEALASLHGAGVVHRDLTPGNVLVLDGEPHVIDLGLASALDLTALTRTGLLVGTPCYLSPEQVRGTAVGPPADVHAWGATLVYACTGAPPFGTGRPDAVLYRIVHEQPVLDGVPRELVGLVEAALHPDPQRRPGARTLLAALGGATGAAPVSVQLPRDVEATTVLARPELAHPELAHPDLAHSDLAHSDLAHSELAGPAAVGGAAAVTSRLVPAAPSPLDAPSLPAAPEPITARLPVVQPPRLPPPDEHGLSTAPLRTPAPAQTRQLTRQGAGRTGPPPDWPPHQQAAQGWPPDQRPPGWERTPQPAYEPEPEQRLPAARRLQLVLTSLAALALLGVATLFAPTLAAAGALVGLVVLRAVGRSADRLGRRRERRGARSSDAVLAVLGAPWHLLAAALDTLLSLPLLLLVAALPAAAAAAAAVGPDGRLQAVQSAAAVAVVVGVLVALRRRVHRSSRRFLADGLLSVTPGLAGAAVVVALLVLATLLLLGAAQTQPATWWPAGSAPF